MSKVHTSRSIQFVIFTTVLVDLIGFGMVIPLIGLYGRHYGAQGLELSLLGGIYSIMQFFFAPLWGALSDRYGRRPILLMSLAGSAGSYLIFAFAPNTTWLILARAFGGLFAANISTAQATIADVTPPEKRAQGMGLIGAAFGIGFTLGPPLGGIASAQFGIQAPGLIAAAICTLNLIAAYFRLPETRVSRQGLAGGRRSLSPLSLSAITRLSRHAQGTALAFLLFAFFAVTFAFSNMEQTFSLLFQDKFGLDTSDAGLKTGLVLMTSGILGAVIQGGLIRKWVPRYGEWNLLKAGLVFNGIAMLSFPWGPTYWSYFLLTIPLSLGSSLINPSINSLISRSVGSEEQGLTLGISQGLGSLARASGPFCGLLTYQIARQLPYQIAAAIAGVVLVGVVRVHRKD